MDKKLLATCASLLLAGAAHASPVELHQGIALTEQLNAIAQREGYTLAWRLPLDDKAKGAAHLYPNWIDAFNGATQQLSTITATRVDIADGTVALVCSGPKTILITTARDARQFAPVCRELK